MPTRTWQVTASAAKTLALALFLLAVALAACELAARSAVVRSRLLPPSVDNPSRPFEQQLAGLDEFVRAHGRVDCVFLGNSLVLTGIDPEVFGAAFASQTHHPIACFNFAVPGVTVTDVAIMARIVQEDYQPWLLVYGATFRDFSTAATGPQLVGTVWVQYRLGAFTVDGWLTDHSQAYRYYLTYRTFGDAERRRLMARLLPLQADGFLPGVTPGRDLDAQITAMTKALDLEQFHVAERHVAALGDLLASRGGGTQVLLVEMPAARAFSEWVITTDAYRRLSEPIRQVARRGGAVFWEAARTVPTDLIPDDGWRDPYHFSTPGAEVMSRWLGGRVAQAVRDGELKPPPAR